MDSDSQPYHSRFNLIKIIANPFFLAMLVAWPSGFLTIWHLILEVFSSRRKQHIRSEAGL